MFRISDRSVFYLTTNINQRLRKKRKILSVSKLYFSLPLTKEERFISWVKNQYVA